jgi:hypothetical protein
MSYAEYVDGKSIAAVGRAKPFGDQSKEVSGHDLIMVTGYRGEVVPEYYSSCNITVQNRFSAQKLRDTPGLAESLKVDWFLFRTPKFMPTGSFNTRVVGGPVYFNNLGNQIPIFLNDIVRFRPSKVTVYGTDFYLSGYDTSRPDGDQADFDNWKNSIVEHDQPRVRRYCQLMCELYPFIVPDVRLDRILGMSDSEFWSELSDVWGGL